MNRAERRRQDNGKNAQTLGDLQRVLTEAMAHHQAGRLQQAAQLYQKILSEHPQHAESFHLLGLIAYKTDHFDEAAALIADAIRQDATKAAYRFNLGVVLQKQGKLDEAAEAYRHAVKLNPSYIEAYSNLGNLLMEQGKLDEAIAMHRAAIRLKPNAADAHNNLGVALKEQGKLVEALTSYQEALKLNPRHVEAQCNLGIARMDQGKLEEAITELKKALSLKTDYVKAHYHLAFAYVWQHRLDDAVASFRASAAIKQDHGHPVYESGVSKARLKHDAEQISYLMEHGRLDHRYDDYLRVLQQLRQGATQQTDGSWRMPVGQNELNVIAPSYNRILYYAECPQLKNGAINPSLEVAAIEARYNERKPEIMYVDDLLTDEALQSLRRFCLESTIWKRDYPNGYLGAFLGDGFVCPLLLQIAEELRLKFPGVFRQHKLTQAWAFKYDSELTGLNMHADAAAVNVNFWITPDEANLDPERGGLVVWDKEAPSEWNFKEYNNAKNESKVMEWLGGQGARAVTIPYRHNRAVIFNSDLFHKTDRFRFKDDYASRRLNVTLLYGRRGEA